LSRADFEGRLARTYAALRRMVTIIVVLSRDATKKLLHLRVNAKLHSTKNKKLRRPAWELRET
jgi:hypothetical protein